MVTFVNLLSWDGTELRDAGDALVAASHKYEQVSVDLKAKGLGDGLAGKTAEAEAKARRILADDAEDLWSGLGKAGHDFIDAHTTVDAICDAANNLVSRIKADGLEMSEVGAITPVEESGPAGEPRSRDVTNLIRGYERERDRLMEQANDTIEFISSVYDEIASLDDLRMGQVPRSSMPAIKLRTLTGRLVELMIGGLLSVPSCSSISFRNTPLGLGVETEFL